MHDRLSEEPLLLHSLTEFREVIFGCLDAVSPRRVVEIGTEEGGFTRVLADWTREHGATLTSIEPEPRPELRRMSEELEHFTLVEGRSPEALADLEPADAYIVDGDHTYWTVSRELEAIFGSGAGERRPLAVLHDVGWPCARRDQYYNPDALPADAVHAHSYEKGRLPGEPGAVDGGFRGGGEFAVALEEGGPRNGVLTAVEDFLERRDDLVYRHIPLIFGLGFVFPGEASWATAVKRLLDPFDRNELLARMERNRITLFLHVLELQDAVADARVRQNRLLLGHAERLSDAHAESAAQRLEALRLRSELRRLHEAGSPDA
jgi:hypothetical protein